MAQTRKPQDRQSKKSKGNPTEPFEFTHDGETYTLAAPDTIKTGFWRRNRGMGDTDAVFALVEKLADGDDDPALDAIDDMSRDEFRDFQKALFGHMGIDVGESKAS